MKKLRRLPYVSSTALIVLIAGSFLFALQANDAPGDLSGHVFDDDGKPMEGVEVRLLGTKSEEGDALTDSEGKFALKAPRDQYLVVFKEPRTHTIVLEYRQLSGKSHQELNVVMGAKTQEFEHVYGTLQAVEALATYAMEGEGQRSGVLKSFPYADLQGILLKALPDLKAPSLTGQQQDFLSTKFNCAQEAVKRLG